MTIRAMPICPGCVRYHQPTAGLLKCDAFPLGIPDPILRNEADHRQPFEGDHGILFLPRNPDDAEYADRVLAKAQVGGP